MGVAPADDGKYVCHDYAVVLKSTLDIRHLAKLTGYETGGLAMLSSTLLGTTLDKSWRVRFNSQLSPHGFRKQDKSFSENWKMDYICIYNIK